MLSFPQQELQELQKLSQLSLEEVPDWQLGDIVISLETAARQAKEKKISYHRELEILLIHGFLHLLGYDHEISLKEERRMKRLERALLTR